MMTLHEISLAIINFIELHQNWAILVIFLLAFGESMALISLLIPATAILIAVGALIGGNVLPFLPIWLAASMGAILGDWLSYWLGKHYHQQIIALWPLCKHPQIITKGENFFSRWGGAGIFIGRFFGPLRAIVPLIAGTMRVQPFKFWLANITSAPIWAFILFAPGMFGIRWLETIFG